MTDEEIESHRQNLCRLTSKLTDKQKESSIKKELQSLARRVGASTTIMWANTLYAGRPESKEAYTSVLIYNIHHALQTATMVNMSKAANESSAVANKNAVIALIATAIAFFSAVAVWLGVLV